MSDEDAGASVHPCRLDALDELHRVAERGAVLIKWLPNAQGMDPAAPKLTPFYRTLTALGLLLLSHVAHEYSLGHGGQALGDPRRLRRALDEGVTVIGAHCAGAGCADDGRENFLHFLDLTREYPNLYGDLSALTLTNRWPYLRRILHFAIKRAMGVADEVFSRGYTVLPVTRSLERLGRSPRSS